MYEEATGKSLVGGSASETKEASKLFQRLTSSGSAFGVTQGPLRGVANPSVGNKDFRYANYAEGGACGGIPAISLAKPALGTFKDQVERYTSDFRTLNQPGLTLFMVWFGANDLYTAGCKPTAMAGVAEKVSNKRRHELSRLVGAANARFIFMNLARPEASVRYQDELKQRKGTKKDRFYKFLGGGVEKELNDFRMGADLYNTKLLEYASANGDVVVDIASVAHPDVIGSALQELGLLAGAQAEGTSNQHVPAAVYDNPKLARKYLGNATNLTTSDKAHPTDKVYKLMWNQIKFSILQKQYSFGNLG